MYSRGHAHPSAYWLETVRADGGGRRILVRHASENVDATFSPNGRRLAFVRVLPEAHRYPSVFVAAADGTAPRRIARYAEDPSWSPDGRRIAFVRGGAIGGIAALRPTFWVMDADGRRQRRLGTFGVWGGGPSWSPDGRRLAVEDGADIVVVDVARSTRARIAGTRAPDITPAWSARNEIAYVTRRQRGGELVVVDPTGRRRRTLLSIRGNAFGRGPARPVWSLDGGQLAFELDERVHVIDADGGRRRAVTPRGWVAAGAVWAPDGSRLAFTRSLRGNQDVYVVNADGSGLRLVAGTKAFELATSWQAVR